LSIHHTTGSYGYMCQKLFFSKNLVVVLEIAVLERLGWIHSHGTLGVNIVLVQYEWPTNAVIFLNIVQDMHIPFIPFHLLFIS